MQPPPKALVMNVTLSASGCLSNMESPDIDVVIDLLVCDMAVHLPMAPAVVLESFVDIVFRHSMAGAIEAVFHSLNYPHETVSVSVVVTGAVDTLVCSSWLRRRSLARAGRPRS